MFIIYEYAACLFAVLLGATLLFATCVMFLVLQEGGSIVARTWQELTHGTPWLTGRRVAAEPREP
jgi:hypothetical protein